ncbi:uncharacterized protein ATNIH1004_002213 [Aspergillus tanneri]|uniref:AB hydrolase-1 domain-containing protein n=1 Tax=Aspergillus tanneri TaxID=1220188 RepID=A0A5M9MR03_9EURO|nr:uncharacterized protein ATNIH1004_002213 [Aspergillus tanneri]KAA8649542.1 hypothetical protein ATNIH1004_002213 [Aspergillus tanneri]
MYCLFLLSVLWTLSTATPAAIPEFVFDGDAPYNIPADALRASLTCPNGTPNSNDKPVLLVHGTGSTGNESWGRGFVPALAETGMKACFTNLRETEDTANSALVAFLAADLFLLFSKSIYVGRPIAAIGHSQGSPNIQWALRFFPSTRNADVTRAFIAMSPDFAGVGFDGIAAFCDIIDGVRFCTPSLWQQAAGSNFMKALNGGSHGINRAYVPTTIVWSRTDEIVVPPYQNSRLSGAVMIAAQDLCPLRVVGHLLMTIDAAGFAIALDALNNDGHANVSRIDESVCRNFLAPGMNPTLASLTEAGTNDIVKGFLLGGPKTKEEPALLPYAV